MTAGVDPELSDAFGESPAKLKITLKDGQTFEQRRDYATGSKQVPMTQAQVEDEVHRLLPRRRSAPTSRSKILATLNTIAERRSFDDFWSLIRA